MRFSDWVTSRVASGWMARLERSAAQIEADEVDRIAFESVGADDVDAVVIDLEVDRVVERLRPPPQPAKEAVEPLGRLGLPLFERGADDCGQVADVLGDEEIMLHEPFDVGLAGPRGVAEPLGDRPLHVEAQPLLGATSEEMEVAAHPPQEFFAAREQSEFALREQARFDQFARIVNPIDVLGDPEQRVEVA